MKKLKCWMPTRSHRIGTKVLEMENKSEDSILWISPGISNYVNYAAFAGGLWHHGFTKDLKSKSKALSFANKYMKEHDTC